MEPPAKRTMRAAGHHQPRDPAILPLRGVTNVLEYRFYAGSVLETRFGRRREDAQA